MRAPSWAVAAAGAAGLVAARHPRLFALALLLAGWWWGSARLDALDRSVLAAEVGSAARATAVVTGPARRGAFALRLPARLERFGDRAAGERVLLLLPLGRAPPQGARLELVARIERPRPPSEDFDEAAWLRRQGVHVVVEGSYWRVVGRRGGIAGLGDRLRSRLAGTIARGVERERSAVIAGIVLGEDEGLPEGLRDAFRASGLYHVLAVSGANIALLAAGVLGLAWLAGVPLWAGHAGALAAILGYVLAVGWQPSVVRAGVAGLLVSVAWLTARQRDRWHFLLLGAAVLLAWNPWSLLEPGFQLSFAAVAAIFVAVPRVHRRLEGYPVPRALGDVLAVSLACGVATAPILWLHFGAVPVFSVLANAVAWPVVGPLLGLGLAAAALDPVAPGLAESVAWANGWLAAYLAACARVVGGLPHAEATSAAVLLALAAAALAVAARGRARALAVVATASALLALAGWRQAPELPAPDGLRIAALDVGQGDAILLQSPGGTALVDQGAPEADVAGQLRRLGVRRIDLLVLTHPQRDHVGGAAEVVRRLEVGLVLDPGLAAASPDREVALAEARRRGVRVAAARRGQEYRLGLLRLRVLWPDGPGSPAENPNDRAVVLLASYGELDALLTADAESDVLLPLRPPPVEVLKVSHHGSADAGLPALLRLLRPRLAIVSAGEDNDYGHPAPSTVAALRGVPLYRTDRHGRVVVESDGTRMAVWPSSSPRT